MYGVGPSVATANDSWLSRELLEQIERIEASATHNRSAPYKASTRERIETVIVTAKHLEPQELDALLNEAEVEAKIWQQNRGAGFWETINAQQRLQNLRKWAHLTAEDRAAWAQRYSLNRQAYELYKLGKYHEMQPLLERALENAERVLGPDHLGTAQDLVELAWSYFIHEQYAHAQSLNERALGIREKVLGPDHPVTASSLRDLAALYLAKGQYAQGVPLAKRALAITEKAQGPDHQDMVSMLDTLALLYKFQLKHVEAVPLAKRALAITDKAFLWFNPINTIRSLLTLAHLYRDQMQYALAQPLFEKALAISEAQLGPDHLETAQNLTALAHLYEDQEQYSKALPLYEQALGIYEKSLEPNHPKTAIGLTNVAKVYSAQGHYAQAQPFYKRALAINEKALGPNHSDTVESLVNLADFYEVQGQYGQAKPLYEQALAINEEVLGDDHPNTAESLYALGVQYHVQGQYSQAQPLYERALAIDEKVLGPNHPNTAMVLKDLAVLKLNLQPDKEAAQLLLRASQAKWQYLTRTFPTLPTASKQQLLVKNQLRTTSKYFWPLFTALPSLDRAMGFQVILLSKQLVAEATRHESQALRQILGDAPPTWRTLWHQWDDLRRQYATRALRDLQDDPAQPRPTAQGPANDPISVRQLSEQIDQLDQQLRRDNPVYANLAQLEQVGVAQVRAALRPQDLLLEYVQFQPYDSQTKKFLKPLHYGVYVVRGDRSPIVALDLGEASPIDAAIQQYHKDLREVIDLINDGSTPSLTVITESEAKLAGLSSTIRAAIWKPPTPHLRGVTRVYLAPEGQLSLLPFEVLAKKTKKKKWTYLAEELELVYLNTGRDLARLAATTGSTDPSTSTTKQAVLIGNPAFWANPTDVARAIAALPPSTPTVMAENEPSGDSPTLGFGETSPRLDVPRRWRNVPELGTLLHDSKKQLTGHGWDVTTIEQQQAVEEAVLRVQAPQLLQLATHGYLLDPTPGAQRQDNPLLRSMLLFSGVNQADPAQTVFYRVGDDMLSEADARKRGLTDEDLQQARIDIGDGILTAYEVTGMNLQGTELVNLTACETGLGQVTPDGVIGLRQAFLLAGARALTTSLWEVPVEETTQQVEAFYTHWLGDGKRTKPKPRYAAFHETQLEALAHARQQYGVGHPFYWAGTIYLGDPGDLPTQAQLLKR